jgi:DNA-binding NtrC family response regulator
VRHVHPDVYEYLAEQSWPGNVRQLLHEVEKATIFADSAELCRADFRLDPLERRREDVAASLPQIGTHIGAHTGAKGPRIHDSTHQVAQAMVRDALDRFGGNKRRVAHELGISRSYLYRLLQTKSDAATSA